MTLQRGERGGERSLRGLTRRDAERLGHPEATPCAREGCARSWSGDPGASSRSVVDRAARIGAVRMRVLHVITGLGIGGAQLMLERLLEASRSDDVTHEVVSLTELGVVADRIQEHGVRTIALGMPRSSVRYPDPLRLLRLIRIVRERRPDVVQTWLYHADLLGGLAAKLAGGARIFWGLHHSTIDPVRTRRTTRWTVAACARSATR
jgi:hypothetical protein